MYDKPKAKVVLDVKSKDVRRLLKVRITYNCVSRYYNTTCKTPLTDGEFANDNLKKTKNAILMLILRLVVKMKNSCAARKLSSKKPLEPQKPRKTSLKILSKRAMLKTAKLLKRLLLIKNVRLIF